MATMSGNIFAYDALPSSTCIRLVDFDQRGSTPVADGEISFTLNTFELNSAPPFDALSYTWGDPSCPYLSSAKISGHSRNLVRCNDASLEVQANLFAALEELQTVEIPRSRYIWIDAICINQENLPERSSQVQLMGRLYEQAESVILWLGQEDETVADAFMVLERLGSVGRVPRNKTQLEEARAAVSNISRSDFYDTACYPTKLGIEPFSSRQWLSVVALLHRPYFKRVWVIQEIAQARKIVVVCGRKLLAWTNLSAALMFLALTNWHLELHTEILNLRVKDPKARLGFEAMLAAKDNGGTAAIQLVKTREFSQGEAGRYRLEDLISTHRPCLATDPRDKIYSLLGISNFDKPPFVDPRTAQCLVADYQLPVEALYTKVTRALLESRGDLRILMQRESNRERSLRNLPSWVPDFSVWQMPTSLPVKSAANGDWAWIPDRRKHDDGILEVQGQFLGVIEACSIPPFETLETPVWGSIAEVARGIPGYYKFFHSGSTSFRVESRIEALARTCIADTLGSQTPAPPELLFNQFMCKVATLCGSGYKWYGDKDLPITSRIAGKIHRFNISKFDRSINEPRITPWFRLFKEEPTGSAYNVDALLENFQRISSGDLGDYADYQRQTQLVTGYRVIFRTHNKLLGAGPIDVREGDEVWILAGLSEPAVLRPRRVKAQQAKVREFLGTAYVHGVMNGEAAGSGLLKENVILQ